MVGFLQKHALICWVDKQLLHVSGHWFDVYLVVGEEASSCPTAINFSMISLECVRILCKGSTNLHLLMFSQALKRPILMYLQHFRPTIMAY